MEKVDEHRKKRRMMRIMNGGCCKRGTTMELIMDKKWKLCY
jgi:hypothetical protein